MNSLLWEYWGDRYNRDYGNHDKSTQISQEYIALSWSWAKRSGWVKWDTKWEKVMCKIVKYSRNLVDESLLFGQLCEGTRLEIEALLKRTTMRSLGECVDRPLWNLQAEDGMSYKLDLDDVFEHGDGAYGTERYVWLVLLTEGSGLALLPLPWTESNPVYRRIGVFRTGGTTSPNRGPKMV